MRHGPALFVVLAAAASCSAPAEQELRGRTMGTTYSVKWHGTATTRDVVRSRVEKELEHIEALFSTYRSDSEISRFNAYRSTEPFDASPEMAALVRRALAVAEKTDGAFDPTVLPLVELYGFGPAPERRIPAEAEVAAALERVGWRKLEVTTQGRLRKARPDLQLDLSGIAKGYGVDRVAAALVELGAAGYMVEIGGEVRCGGVKAGGAPWRIGIERPPEDGALRAILEVVEVRDAAIATSGSYRNYVLRGGRFAHHVLDPRTGRNAPTGVLSVSVRAPDCTLADALATAFMVLGPEPAERVLDRFSTIPIGLLFVRRAAEGGLETRRVRWR